MSENYTPMINQYRKIKSQHPDEILFFRLGDFYEMFFEDAHLASRELEIVLTGRDGGSADKIPMCGVPYHAAENYIAKLIKKGYKIAICEQVQDPKDAKGIVQREVIKIITPGTAMSEQILQDNINQYLLLFYEQDDLLSLIAVDISTGECLWGLLSGSDKYDRAQDFIYQISPVEIVSVSAIAVMPQMEEFCKQKLINCTYSIHHPDSIGQKEGLLKKHFKDVDKLHDVVKTALEYMLSYLHTTVKQDLSHINKLTKLSYEQTMMLDVTAIRNLEILKNMHDGSKKNTLLDILDFTFTAMGKRQLRKFLQMPLVNVSQIRARQGVVADLLLDISLRETLKENLKNIQDIERIIAKVEIGTANARDLAALTATLAVLPTVKQVLLNTQSQSLKNIANAFELHTNLYTLLYNAIVEQPPFSVREGGMIKQGYDIELDSLRQIAQESRSWLSEFEAKQRETTGIKTLKVGYNKVFGYYIEITKSNINLAPDYYTRKQTLANAERYIVPELKEFENKVLGAQERIEQLEYHIFNSLREQVRSYVVQLQNTAYMIAQIDAFLSLAIAADKYNYICPDLNDRKEIIIKDGRHPVVEKLLREEMFVPNDTYLNVFDNRTLIITGPNMAGKSTYMRQVALLVLMTQIGSFIPARQASICPVDRIFTRVGASDDLASGQSTFMVEMTEVAQILSYATANSLIILDEVGRGTSTYDGMSIAQAVIEYISKKIKAKTLFATHYHELIELENQLDDVKNYSVAVKEKGNKVLFLRRIVPGGADKSYGIHVAQLAGLPKDLLDNAQALLTCYDSKEPLCKMQPQQAIAQQDTLFASTLGRMLCQIDVSTMTPLEALNKLFELQKQAKQEAGMF